MASASASVLGTYELLENILLHLSLEDLFVVQRVATSWKDLLRRSKGLQKKMFLIPDSKAKIPGEDYPWYDYEEWPVYETKVQLNPALQLTPGGLTFWDIEYERDLSRRSHIGSIWPIWDWNISEERYGGFEISIKTCQTATRAEDVFLTQPPITTLLHTWCDDDEARMEVTYREEGIRLGHLMDEKKEIDEQYAAFESEESDGSELQDERGPRSPPQQWSFGLRGDGLGEAKKCEEGSGEGDSDEEESYEGESYEEEGGEHENRDE